MNKTEINMSDNKNKKDLVRKIIQVCEDGDLDKFKELIPDVSLDNEYHIETETAKKFFQSACFSGNLELVKLFIDTPHLCEQINSANIICQTFDLLMENHEPKIYPILSYLISESKLERASAFESSLIWHLRDAARFDNLPLFKVLLNEDTIEKNNKSFLLDTRMIENASQHKEFKILKYIYNKHEFKGQFQPENGFKDACYFGNINLLSFLIFDYKIEKSDEIKRFLAQDNYEDAERMFELRHVNEQLNSELGSNQNNNKKIKI
jgi:hypothetical protein